MSKEYTEIIENSYPEHMMGYYKKHIKYLERELRKLQVKSSELQQKINQRNPISIMDW